MYTNLYKSIFCVNSDWNCFTHIRHLWLFGLDSDGDEIKNAIHILRVCLFVDFPTCLMFWIRAKATQLIYTYEKKRYQ